ncbi:MAG TPA: PLP-dependent aminotransferase family protein [Gemmatimonadaceae bacterium]|nr:PLP-dependent aminotransferase family protein [Gemmatimonadaceae bacterium]
MARISAPTQWIELDRGSNKPLTRQIVDGLRSDILRGRLHAGTRLAGARELAAALGVSRTTVDAAIGQLRAEGYVYGKQRSGTFVVQGLPDQLLSVGSAPTAPLAPGLARPPRLSARGVRMALSNSDAGRARSHAVPFALGIPALDAFPWRTWAQLTARFWRKLPPESLLYGDAAGYAPLRQAVAAHVRHARGIECSADQVFIVEGSQQGLDLATRLVVDPDDEVWVEDPGYNGARAAIESAGATLVPVPVDDEGLDVRTGRRLAPTARAAYVTPSHQYPLGVTLTATRRLALLEWAREADAWIIEDDYDSEYRYTSAPLPSLRTLDVDGRVVYIGTFSKTLFPALRMGYVIVPSHLVDAFRVARGVSGRHAPGVQQAVLAAFVEGGHYERHIRRMRTLYQERRAVLLERGRAWIPQLDFRPHDGGMHVVARLTAPLADQTIVAAARSVGLELAPVSAHSLVQKQQGLLLGFAGFSADRITRGCEQLARVMDRVASA